MTPDELRTIGDALYGHLTQWHAVMAFDLEISDRSLQRWLNGERPIPDNVATDLANICRTRAVQLGDVAHRLDGLRPRVLNG